MDKKDNQILKLTFEFSIQVVLYCELLEEKRKYVIANQLLKSGTSLEPIAKKHKMPKVRLTSFTK